MLGRCVFALSIVLACVVVGSAHAVPVGSAFTYQGQITKDGVPYEGTCDLLLRLYDDPGAGNQVGSDVSISGVTVTQGVFSVIPDFGAAVFTGEARWMEVSVETPGDADWTLLTPRQPITATPYASYAVASPGGSQPWVVAPGAGVTCQSGSVGVTSWSTIGIGAGNGVWMEGNHPGWANLWSYNYNAGVPQDLLINFPGGNVGICPTTYIPARFYVDSGTANINTGWFTNRNNSYATLAAINNGTAPAVYAVNNQPGGVALLAVGTAQVSKLQILGGADLAERFDAPADVEPGTVMVIDAATPGAMRVCDEAYCRRVAGVVSGAGSLPAGVVLGTESKNPTQPIALTGRVWVKGDARRAPIHVGDLLTTSDMPGHAMAASDPTSAFGAILGKAMSSLETGTGRVLVLVSLQ
jgi:hypothetical protein